MTLVSSSQADADAGQFWARVRQADGMWCSTNSEDLKMSQAVLRVPSETTQVLLYAHDTDCDAQMPARLKELRDSVVTAIEAKKVLTLSFAA